MRILCTGLVAALCAGTPALAQSDEGAPLERDRVLRAIELPAEAEALRDKGVPDDEVREAVEAARDEGVAPDEAADALQSAGNAADEHGQIDNFGGFVRDQLAEGKRGTELAEAIRAEHAARGKPADAGRPEGAGKPTDAGRPEGAGKPTDGGKPTDAGERPAPDDDEQEATGSRGETGEAARRGKGKPATEGDDTRRNQ